MKKTVVMLAFALFLVPRLAQACPAPVPANGPVVGPTSICFPASPNHSVVALGQALVAGYKVTLTVNGTTTAVDVGKPTPNTAGDIVLTNWPPLASLTANASYTATVLTYGPGGTTPGGVSVPFGRLGAPAAPGAPVPLP